MRKALIFIVFLMGCAKCGWCGFLVTKTASIEGVVIDSVSHHPIENAIVGLQIYGGSFQSIEGIGTERVGEPYIVATDQNGRYRIPSQYWFTPLGFKGISIEIRHLLYADAGIQLEGQQYREFVKSRRIGKHIHFDAELLRLDHVYSKRVPWPQYVPPLFDYLTAVNNLKLAIDAEAILRQWEIWKKQIPDMPELSSYDLEKLKNMALLKNTTEQNNLK